MKTPIRVIGLVFASSILISFLTPSTLQAQAANPTDSGFSIEVSPSPLVTTLKPGEPKTLELRIRNNNTITESLKLDLRSFDVNKDTGEVQLLADKLPEISDWISFEQPLFSINPGQTSVQRVTIDTPASAGFSYSFAIGVGRQKVQSATTDTAIEGSVAVFTLLNIDNPNATKKLEIVELKSDKKVYEYLPASFTIRLKNSGNTIIRPGGNVFVQRDANSTKPISALTLNPNGSYLLPGVTRSFPVAWDDGFPHYITVREAANVQPRKSLEWNWGKSEIRIGRYTARLVAVYNDGQRDVPVQSEVSFWVFPWKIVLGLLLALITIVIGIIAIFKTILPRLRGNSRSRYRYRRDK